MKELERKMRMDLLRDFDYYIRNIIGDDDIFYGTWSALGLPDGWFENDLREIANDDELWLGCVNAFFRCCKADMEN